MMLPLLLIANSGDSLRRHVGALQENTQSGLEDVETVVRRLIGVPAQGIIFP